MKKSLKKNWIMIIYSLMLLISFSTMIYGFTKVNFNKDGSYDDFSSGWYSDGEMIDLSEAYKYEKVSKTLPESYKDTQIYMNVKSINLDVYIDDELIYEYEDYDKKLFGKTPGSYFVKLDIDKSYAGKTITFDLENVYDDTTGKITEIYIGDALDVALNFAFRHILGNLLSLLILFMGIIFIAVYLVSKKYIKLSMKKVLYLGLFSFAIGLFTFTDSKFLQIINGNEYFYHMISETCMILFTVPLILFISESYKKTCTKFLVNALCILGIINFVFCYFANAFNILDYHESLFFTHFVYGLDVIYIICMSIKSMINKNKKEMYHTIGLWFICGGCLIDICLLYFGSTMQTSLYTRLGVLVFMALEGIKFFLEFLEMFRENEKTKLLKRLAYQDGLTELLNRTSFMEDMESLKDIKNGLIAVYDVNYLKQVNDTYGHSEGDRLIKKAADEIRINLSAFGKCYRIGGDEFVFISTEEDIEQEFKDANNNINKNLKSYDKNSKNPYSTNIAMGYSKITSKRNINKAFEMADSSMYKNKIKMKKKKN